MVLHGLMNNRAKSLDRATKPTQGKQLHDVSSMIKIIPGMKGGGVVISLRHPVLPEFTSGPAVFTTAVFYACGVPVI